MSIVRSFPVLMLLCLPACGAPPACPSGPCAPGIEDAGPRPAGDAAPGDDTAPIADRADVADIEIPGLADASVPCVPRDETCNGEDDDCDGATDEGALLEFHRDADGDAFGDATITVTACAAPAGFVLDATDCADDCATCHPGATEICDEVDQDCDGDAVEDDLRTSYFADADGDGFSPGLDGMVRLCALAPGYTDRVPSPDATDCADSDPRAFPGQTAYSQTPVAGVTGTIARWDFDCDGTAEGEHGIGGSCDTSLVCSGRTGAFVGTTRPSCGASATFQDACGRVMEGPLYVCRSRTSTRTQACR